MKTNMELFLKHKNLFFIFLLTLLSVIPLFHYGLIPTHDGEYHVVRFAQFDKVLREGNFYPRWAPDFNNSYGIPLFNYVYPLPNYFASFFHFLGLSFIDSFKASLIIASMLAGFFFFRWLSLFFNNTAALVGTIFFIYAPYRFVDIYVRGSVGELWAMAFFPGFLWAVTYMIQGKKRIYVVYAAIFLALTILSHNIVGLMFFIFGTVYSIFLILNNKEKLLFHIQNIILVILLSLGLSAIFWIPALFEKEYVKGLEIYDIKNNFAEIYNLIFPSWGTGFSEGSFNNQMSFQIGVANLLVIFISFFLFIKKNKYRILAFFFLLSLLTTSFLILPFSEKIWEVMPLIRYFQFPWRFLSLIIIYTGFLAGYVTYTLNKKIYSLFFITVCILLSISYTKPAYYLEREDSYYLTRSNFIDGTNSPGNVFNTLWITNKLEKSNKKIREEKGIVVKSQVITSTEYRFAISAQNSTQLTVNTAYFPGWAIFVDEKQVKTQYNTDGLIFFDMPKGVHEVVITFKNTPIRLWSEITTVLSCLVVTFVLIRQKIRRT